MAIGIAVGLHVSSADVWTELKDCWVLNVWCDIEAPHDWSMLNQFLRHNETVYLLFVQIRTLFSRGAVLIFSWLQERSSAKNDVQTAVPSSCNERTSFRTMSVQFWNKNVVQAVRTILQRSNAQNGVRTAVLFNYFCRGFYLPRMYLSFCVIFLKWDNRKLAL